MTRPRADTATTRRAWPALLAGALLHTTAAHADLTSPWDPPRASRVISSPDPLPASKVSLGLPDPSRWELATLAALGVACAAGAVAFGVTAYRRRRDP